ncbi:MAG: hypothetical protein GXO74_01865 [Calditrichaeota bacterium]|nr:hypothetical protein [Calditrichota bacterium]
MAVLVIISGYLMGNILPAYYFGRLKGIDIRNEGAEYAGTINVYHVLGLKFALLTGLVDLLKGVFAIQIALALGADFRLAQWSGIAAVAGHVLPFYLNFRGGQGVACATGILLYYLIHFLLSGGIPITALLYFAVVVVIFAYVAREGEIISQIILPLLVLTSIHNAPDDPRNVFFAMIAIYIMAVGMHNIIARQLMTIPDEEFARFRWRIFLRPFALLLIFIYLIYGKNQALILIGALLLVSLVLDMDRISGKNFLSRIFFKDFTFSKPNEKRQLSSITLFLFSFALVLWLFPKLIAFTSILLLIFGDMFGKIFGMAFHRHRFFNKSLEGSLAFFGCGLICSYVLTLLFNWNFILLLIGVVAATVTEAMSRKISDNLSVPIVSSIAMVLAHAAGISFLNF